MKRFNTNTNIYGYLFSDKNKNTVAIQEINALP